MPDVFNSKSASAVGNVSSEAQTIKDVFKEVVALINVIALEANVPVAFESVGETLSDICPKGDKLNGTIFITKQYNITIEIIQYLGH